MSAKVVMAVASFLAVGLVVGCSSSPMAAPPLPSDTATSMPSPTVLPAQAKALMSRCRSVPMTGRWWLRAVLDRLVSRRVMLNGSCGPSCSILFDPTSTSFPTSC